MEYGELLLAALALAAGGVLKGAIGAGAPILAIPILALLYDVPFAVAIFALPNLLSNLWQGWSYRHHQLQGRFVLLFSASAAVGAFFGTLLLALLSGTLLMAIVAMAVFVYIAIRLLRPDWVLSREVGTRVAGYVGFVGGIVQGAGGISAPVSVTFLNAMRLERSEFIATISVFFATMAVVQIPTLWTLGILTPERLGLSLAAGLPLFGAMPLGSWLAKRISKEIFDRVILVLLTVVALRLLYAAFV